MLNWRDPRNPKAGGAERVSLGYLRALADRGHEVFWFSHHFPGAEQEQAIDGVRILRGGGVLTSVVAAWKWYRRQPPFDLVIDQHHGIPWFAPWWSGTHVVAYIHEVLGPIWEAFYPWPISRFGQWQERWTHWFYRRIPCWVGSESTRQALLGHGVKDITLIPYGLDSEPIRQLPPKPLAQPLQLAVVSRLAPNKRIDHAIRLLRCLADRQIDARLTVMGSGEETAKLKTLSERLNVRSQVNFAGPMAEKEKNEQLVRAHFLAHTSIREGWGLNVLEANAMGAPAIVYPVPGLIDSTVDGETGWVAKRETPESMAERIEDILKNPESYERCRTHAWNRSKQFQWNQVLPQACQWLEAQAQGIQ